MFDVHACARGVLLLRLALHKPHVAVQVLGYRFLFTCTSMTKDR